MNIRTLTRCWGKKLLYVMVGISCYCYCTSCVHREPSDMVSAADAYANMNYEYPLPSIYVSKSGDDVSYVTNGNEWPLPRILDYIKGACETQGIGRVAPYCMIIYDNISAIEMFDLIKQLTKCGVERYEFRAKDTDADDRVCMLLDHNPLPSKYKPKALAKPTGVRCHADSKL